MVDLMGSIFKKAIGFSTLNTLGVRQLLECNQEVIMEFH
jgi:hypothetical protein